MTFLVLGEPEDESVVSVASLLKERGNDVVVVMSSDLFRGTALSYVIEDERAHFELQLEDRVLHSKSSIELVINRLTIGGDTAGLRAHDRYVGEEWRAAIAGWLRTMPCPVLNPSRGTSVLGLQMSDAEWRVAAARVGLLSAPWPADTTADTSMLVVGDDVLAGVAPSADFIDEAAELAEGVLDLSAAIGVPLMECYFDLEGRGGFVGANSTPDLTPYGETVVDALERAAQVAA